MAIEKIINIKADTTAATAAIKDLTNNINVNSNAAESNSSVLKALDSVTGGLASNVLGLGKTMLNAVKSFDLASLSAKTFRVALISTGIGAIVVALGSLIAAFASTQRGMDAVTSATRPLKAVFDTLIGVAQQLGGILVDLFTKPQQAIKDLKSLASNIFSGNLFSEAIKQGKEIDKLTKQLSKSEGDFILNIAKAKDEFKELNKIAEDTNKPIKEREAAAVKSIEVQKRINRLSANRLDLEIRLLKEKQKQNDTSDEELKLLKELEARKFEANAAANEAITTQNNKVNTIRKEQQSKDASASKERADNERKRFEEITKLREKFFETERDLAAKSELDKLDLERKRAQEELDRLKTTTKEKRELQAALNNVFDKRERELLDAQNKKTEEEEKKQIQDSEKAKEDLKKSLRVLTQEQRLEEERQNALEIFRAGNATQEEILQLELEFIDKANKLKEEKDKEAKAKEKEREEASQRAKFELANNTANLIQEIVGRGSKLGKAVAVAQTTIAGIEGVQNAFKTASASPLAVLNPSYPFVQAGIAGAFSALQIRKILSTDPSGKGATPNTSVSGGGGSAPSAPSFNIVAGSGAGALAQGLAQQNRPVQAFVVSGNVTTAQSLDRNIISNSRL